MRRATGGDEFRGNQAMLGARRNGSLDQMIGLMDRCMANYDETGWTAGAWIK